MLIRQNITFVQKVAKKASENQGEERVFLVPLAHLKAKKEE